MQRRSIPEFGMFWRWQEGAYSACVGDGSMNRLPRSLARATNFPHFLKEPLDFLQQARRIHGNLFVLRDQGPIFSRVSDCAGVVAVFGAEHQRRVLSDIESFGMPVSAARHLRLPPALTKLNHSLHSMRGKEHAVQKRCLAGVLTDRSIGTYDEPVWAALHEWGEVWGPGNSFSLLAEMRRLMLHLSCRVLFGQHHGQCSRLGPLLLTYFHLRREASSPFGLASPESRKALLAAGHALDKALRGYVQRCRHKSRAMSGGLIAKVAALEAEAGKPLSEDEVVGHSNILFVSTTEPIAVALTWILLILSQLPRLRESLGKEARAMLRTNECPSAEREGGLTLLDRVINETLRLLPPNAFMVRLTTRSVSLSGTELPARCEVVLCPFLAHRDAKCFPRPNEFLPERWKGPSPSPFEYFPFGAGGHSCVGKSLATKLIKTVLMFLLSRHTFILAGDQEVDWRVHIMFIPRCDPMVSVQPMEGPPSIQPGRLGGAVSQLLNFGAKAD